MKCFYSWERYGKYSFSIAFNLRLIRFLTNMFIVRCSTSRTTLLSKCPNPSNKSILNISTHTCPFSIESFSNLIVIPLKLIARFGSSANLWSYSGFSSMRRQRAHNRTYIEMESGIIIENLLRHTAIKIGGRVRLADRSSHGVYPVNGIVSAPRYASFANQNCEMIFLIPSWRIPWPIYKK